MNRRSLRTNTAKRSPLKTSTRGGNILKDPSPLDIFSLKNAIAKTTPAKALPRRSLRIKNEDIPTENSITKKKLTTNSKKKVDQENIELKERTPKRRPGKPKITELKNNRNTARKKNTNTVLNKEKDTALKNDINTTSRNGRNSALQVNCSICSKTFKSPAGLKIHSKKCSIKSISAPEPAGEIISVIQEALLKIKAEPDNTPESDSPPVTTSPAPTPSKCQCCGEDSSTAHKVGKFQCYNCSKLFILKASLERHQKVVHLGESHECIQCGAKCPDKGTLARHMYTHTGLKPYSCPVCKQEFSRKYHLVRHNMQTGCDGKERPVFPCQVCGREFNRKDNLREHLRAHAGQTKRKKVFSCDSCDMEFFGTNLLQIHKRTHSGEKNYCCDFCPKRFPSSGAMKKHRRTHTGERPFECSTCGKRFAAKETLNRHARIHTGHKPHVCQYCGKRFIQSYQLRSHLFYHTGQAVFQPAEVFICELCGKTFNRRARLNEHTKFIHLGAKPFECEQCKKTFIRKEDLNRHMIIHSGIKAHKCPICGKSFAMKSSLKVHLLTHTKEPPRSCDECGRAFIRQDCLLRHMRNKHRDMLEEIRSEAEKKKLQQQLLQVAAEASIVEGMEDKGELDEQGLTEAVSELLNLLVDEATLTGLGWPKEGVESVLESVIKRCGHDPAPRTTPSHERLRHNVKLLFTVVIDDSAIKALLNNQTVDQVILHVLRLAKS